MLVEKSTFYSRNPAKWFEPTKTSNKRKQPEVKVR